MVLAGSGGSLTLKGAGDMQGKIAAAAGIGLGILIVLVLAITFLRGKGASLLAGCNTMPQEEQKKRDIGGLLRLAGRSLLLLAVLMALIGVGVWLENVLLTKAALILSAALLIWLLWRSNSGRFRKGE